MSEMVERVAKAIKATRECAYDIFPCENCNVSFDRYGAGCIFTARAAIEAMREPTEAMMKAGNSAAYDSQGSPSDWLGCDMDAVFRAMITAALGEKP